MSAPIAGILGLVNLAEKDVKDHEIADRYVGMIRDKAREMERLLRQIKDTLRIRNDRMVIHRIDFNTLVENVLKSLVPEGGHSHMRLEQDILANQKFYCDQFLLTLLLENLIDNSIKYRKDDAPDPHVKILIRDNGSGIRLTVIDNGIGIVNELPGQVFKMFFRATQKSNGAGLGLCTVEHVVKKLDGEISLESREGEGTAITIQLPEI